MKASRPIPQALGLLLLLGGCGLGTEVGNGFKPDNSGSAGGSPSAQSGTNDTDQTNAPAAYSGNNSGLPADSAAPAAAGSNNGGTTTGTSSASGSTNDPTNTTPGAVPGPVPLRFDINLLVSSCASPLGEPNTGGTFDFWTEAPNGGEDDPQIHGMSDPKTGSWAVDDSASGLLATVTRDPAAGPLAVKATDKNGAPIANVYTHCGPVAVANDVSITDPAGTFTKKTVVLTMPQPDNAAPLTSTVTWYVTTPEGATPAQVVRIELSGNGVQQPAPDAPLVLVTTLQEPSSP